jgi:hypothetical protein
MMAFGRPMGAIDPNLITAIISATGQTASAIATGVAAGKQAETDALRARRNKKVTTASVQVPYTPPAPAAQQSSTVPWVPILLVGSALAGLYLATRRAKPRQSV